VTKRWLNLRRGGYPSLNSWKDLRGWLVDQPAQRQLRHVGNITIAKVTAQREHGGQPQCPLSGVKRTSLPRMLSGDDFNFEL
jgi:hypothetical protein